MKKLLLLNVILANIMFASVVVGEPLKPFSLENQFDKKVTLSNDTKGVIFAFSKAVGHEVKGYLENKDPNYLDSKNILFVADVSAMPSFIRWFVLDDLDKYPYSIVLIEDDDISKEYKPSENKLDKIMFVILENKKVKNIKYFESMKSFNEYISK